MKQSKYDRLCDSIEGILGNLWKYSMCSLPGTVVSFIVLDILFTSGFTGWWNLVHFLNGFIFMVVFWFITEAINKHDLLHHPFRYWWFILLDRKVSSREIYNKTCMGSVYVLQPGTEYKELEDLIEANTTSLFFVGPEWTYFLGKSDYTFFKLLV